MKNKIYLFGIVLVIVFTLGAIFKIMHWPGAAILLTLSLGLFSLVFTPLAIIDAYRVEKKHAFVYVAGLITIIINFSGALFKILHWPGAGIMLTIAIVIPFILFLPAYLIYIGKSSEKQIKNLISVLFVLAYIASMDALLALNVSKAVIGDAELVNDHYSLLAAYYEDNAIEKRHGSDTVHLTELEMLSNKTDNLVSEINSLKKDLLVTLSEDNKSAFNENEILNLSMVSGKDNRQISTTVMIERNKAAELKSEINDYKKFVSELGGRSKSDFINKYLNTDDIEWEGKTYSWEKVHYEGTMLIWAINHLSSLEFHVRLVEAEVREGISAS